jgi:hypothetical protein
MQGVRQAYLFLARRFAHALAENAAPAARFRRFVFVIFSCRDENGSKKLQALRPRTSARAVGNHP